jgi:hypothetical protein
LSFDEKNLNRKRETVRKEGRKGKKNEEGGKKKRKWAVKG